MSKLWELTLNFEHLYKNHFPTDDVSKTEFGGAVIYA